MYSVDSKPINLYIQFNVYSPMYTPTDIHPLIVGMIYTILMYTATDIHTAPAVPWARRAHRHPTTYTYPPIIGRIYAIPMYTPTDIHPIILGMIYTI